MEGRDGGDNCDIKYQISGMIQNLSFLANTMYHFNYTRMSESGTFKTPQAKWIKYPWTTFKVYCNRKKS